jgi:hypothetical protein
MNPGVYRDGWWVLDWNGNHIWDDEDISHLVWWGNGVMNGGMCNSLHNGYEKK